MLQPGAGSHSPHSSPSSDTLPHSTSPQWTMDSADDIQSSSVPAVSADPVQSVPDSVEQQFIPLVDADSGLDRVRSFDAENNMIKKNAELNESFSKNEDNKVENGHVAGSETGKQYEAVKFDSDENVQEEEADTDEEDGDDDMGQADAADADADNVGDNANVDTRNVRVDVSTNKHLKEVKDASANDEGIPAHDLHQPVHPTSSAPELSNSAVNMEATVESGSKGKHFQPFSHQPAASIGRTESGQYNGPHSDAYVRHSSEMGQLPHPAHIRNDFGQHQADIIGHRGNWRQHSQPEDLMFPDEFHQHLDHGAHPLVWKYSSPGEEFRNKWPEMQEAWPELMHKQQYHMHDTIDDYNFMPRDQKHFVHHPLDMARSHVNQQDDYYHRRQSDQTHFSGQTPYVTNSRWPDEDVNYGDMFIGQQHHGHSHQYQQPGIHQPNIHVDQVYQQHPLGQSRTRRFDNKASESGLADDSVHSSEQTDISAVDRKPSSAQWTETDTLLTGQAGDAQYHRDADMVPSSSSQKYTEDASLASSPVLGRSSDHISGV